MPPTPTIDKAYRFWLDIRTTGGIFVGQTGFGARIDDGGWSDANFNAFGADVAAALVSTAVNGAISSGLRFTAIHGFSYDNPGLAQKTYPFSVTGAENGDPLPYNVAAITSFRTPLAGPAFRGRSYMPGYTEASSVANTFNATSRTNLAAFWAQVNSDLASNFGSASLGVVSLSALVVTDVTNIIVESTFATMRPRLDRARNS